MAYKAKPKPHVGVSIEHLPGKKPVYRRHASVKNEFICRIKMPESGYNWTELLFVPLPRPMDRYDGYQWILDHAKNFPRVNDDPELQAWFQSEIDKARGLGEKPEKELQVIIEEPSKEFTDDEADSHKASQFEKISRKHKKLAEAS